jgi:ABC-type antimicrobial peptide transport system permease subunit
LVIRAELGSSSLFASVRDAVASVDSGVPIYHATSYKEMIAEQFVNRRLSTLLVVLFSSATLFLSTVGLYGVLAYFVGQKTREIGIRMALGAQARNVVNLVVKQGLRPVAVGLAIGVLAGLLFARFIEVLLYGVSAYDPITIGLTLLVLGIASLLACLCGASDPDQPDESAKRVAQRRYRRTGFLSRYRAVPVTGVSCYKWVASSDLTQRS